MSIRDLLDDLSREDLLRFQKLVEIRDTRLEFAVDHHINTKGQRMNFKDYPHIYSIYNSLSPNIVIMGAVQVFKSEWLVIDTLAMAKNRLSCFFVLPKSDSKTSYVQNRIDKMIQNVPHYKKLLGQGFFDNTILKNFGDGVIKFVGSNSLADFTEFPGDVLSVEELRDCDQGNVEYGNDRLAASPYKFTRFVSNPGEFDSDIHRKYLNGDQRVRCSPCPHCGQMCELEWFTTVVEAQLDPNGEITAYSLRDKDWAPGCKRDIYVFCPHCYDNGVKQPLNRYDKAGIWQPKNPGAKAESYHFSMLGCSMNSIAYMYELFEKGATNPSDMQRFFNSFLGMPTQSLGAKLTLTHLEKCAHEVLKKEHQYSFIVEGSVSYSNDIGSCEDVSMGVDVGGMFDVRVSGLLPNGVRKALYIGKVKDVDTLYEVIKKYGVKCVVMDSGPETRIAQDFQDTCGLMGVDCWLCYYGSEGADKKLKKVLSEKRVIVDRTNILDEAFSKIRKGKNVLPLNYRELCGGEYVKEMTSSIRTLTIDERKNERYIWSKAKDHARHADVYDLIAAQLLEGYTISDIYL